MQEETETGGGARPLLVAVRRNAGFLGSVFLGSVGFLSPPGRSAQEATEGSSGGMISRSGR